MQPKLTIDALDQIARATNRRIEDEIREALGEKASYPTVSPAAVRIVIDIYNDMLATAVVEQLRSRAAAEAAEQEPTV